MGLIITSKPYSWTTFYALNKHNYYKGFTELEEEINLITISAERPSIKGEELVNVVDYTFKKPPKGLKSSKGNTTYVCVPHISNWKSFSKSHPWLSISDLNISEYPIILTVVKRYMTDKAYKWFFDKYYLWPLKVIIELDNLKGHKNRKGDLLTIDDLKRLYGDKSNREYEYCKYKGTKRGTDVLKEMNKSELWRTFIGLGNRRSYLRQKLDSSTGSELSILGLNTLCLSVMEGKISLSVGCYIFDSWIRDIVNIDYKNSNFIDNKFREIKELLCQI